MAVVYLSVCTASHMVICISHRAAYDNCVVHGSQQLFLIELREIKLKIKTKIWIHQYGQTKYCYKWVFRHAESKYVFSFELAILRHEEFASFCTSILRLFAGCTWNTKILSMTKALRFFRVYAPGGWLYFQISNGVEIALPKSLLHHLICLHDTFLRFG